VHGFAILGPEHGHACFSLRLMASRHHGTATTTAVARVRSLTSLDTLPRWRSMLMRTRFFFIEAWLPQVHSIYLIEARPSCAHFFQIVEARLLNAHPIHFTEVWLQRLHSFWAMARHVICLCILGRSFTRCPTTYLFFLPNTRRRNSHLATTGFL